MQSPNNPPKAATARRPRTALTWVDFLVIAATVLTFLVVVAVNHSRAKAQPRTGLMTIELPVQTSQAPDDANLIKAKIRLATGGPWS
ncbi:MAG: hypothetical protein ACHQK9_12460 [Reyranellales bacterium]